MSKDINQFYITISLQEIRRFLKDKKPFSIANNYDRSNSFADPFDNHNSASQEIWPFTQSNIVKYHNTTEDPNIIPCACPINNRTLRY